MRVTDGTKVMDGRKDERTDHKTIRTEDNKKAGCDGVGLIGVIAKQ